MFAGNPLQVGFRQFAAGCKKRFKFVCPVSNVIELAVGLFFVKIFSMDWGREQKAA